MKTSAPPVVIEPEALTQAMGGIAEETRRFLDHYWQGQIARSAQAPDPLGVMPALQALQQQWLQHPEAVAKAQAGFMQQYLELWQSFAQRLWGLAPAPIVTPAPGDKRFKDQEWQANPFFDFVKQSYLIGANALVKMVADTPGMDEKTARKAAFYVRQFSDALAPTNFIATNPEVLRTTVESGGRNLIEGLKHLLEDFDPTKGVVKPRMVDGSGFELGQNIGATPGKVIFRNEMMELLQFDPTTPTVRKRPLLIMPPWINKFYVLDLQPKNSFIRWAVNQGHTVFVISWVNPGPEMKDKDFEDYVFAGPLAALDAIEKATGETSFNIIGYCIGGTLLGAALAWLCAQGDTRIASATFFTALLDFSDVGDLGVFIDEEQLTALEETLQTRGYLDGSEMAAAFNLIRANDLIWSFVVNNYLLGRAPAAFDLLFWNSDSTRLPAKMLSTYLRKMYMENALRQPGGISLRGEPVDLGCVDIPACFVSAVEDHIAPWKSTFLGAQALASNVHFILGKAGHVAGIINPPGPKAYDHYTGPAIHGLKPEEWLAKASLQKGSWWEAWDKWVAQYADGEVPARHPGDGKLVPLGDAPGTYVRIRAGG